MFSFCYFSWSNLFYGYLNLTAYKSSCRTRLYWPWGLLFCRFLDLVTKSVGGIAKYKGIRLIPWVLYPEYKTVSTSLHLFTCAVSSYKLVSNLPPYKDNNSLHSPQNNFWLLLPAIRPRNQETALALSPCFTCQLHFCFLEPVFLQVAKSFTFSSFKHQSSDDHTVAEWL